MNLNKRVVLPIVLIIILIGMIISAYAFMRYNENLVNLEQYNTDNSFEVSDEIQIFNGWIIAEEALIVNEPLESGKVLDSIPFNTEVEYVMYDSKWAKVEYKGETGYVQLSNISNENEGYTSYDQYVLDNVIGYTSYDVPNTSGFKSFMDYRAITDKSSAQYRLQNEYAETGDYGIRMVNGRYCIAVGSYFTDDIGQYIDLILENGTVIPCVLSDQKANAHTDSNNIVTVHSGCASEFVVDTPRLNNEAKIRGDMSYSTDNWNSRVVMIKVYNKNVFDE